MNFRITIFYNLIICAILALSPFALTATTSSIQSLSQISTCQPYQTLFLFDIDDTIYDSPYMLGSKAWRKYIVNATKQIDPSENWHDIFSYLLAQTYPLKAVEEITSQFVRDLQELGYIVCGFTARERNLWYDTPQDGVDVLTINQLRTLNVDFNNQRLETAYPFLSKNPHYFNGVFFADVEPKGNYLLNLLENAPQFPKKIIFIDDKQSQVESVANTLDKLGISHECYTYTATDAKATRFNPLIANIQLYYFYESEGKTILSDQQAELIAKDNPEKDTEYYLRAAMEMAKDSVKSLN